MAKKYWASVQIVTYRMESRGTTDEMHRVQFTQLTANSVKEVTRELSKILDRHPDAFSTSIYIQYRPFHEWPKKWREV